MFFGGVSVINQEYVSLNKRSEMRLGDILFFFKADVKKSADQVSHVALCTGFDGKTPKISHAIYNKTKTLKKVITSRLRSCYSYLIYRCSDEGLTKEVAALAFKWSTLDIAYDFGREQAMERFLASSTDLDHALSRNVKAYLRREFLQGWKFAARHHSPIRQGSQHGFRCDQFVILCFQVARILMTQRYYFRTLIEQKVQWLSLSYFNLDASQTFVNNNQLRCMSVKMTNQVSDRVRRKRLSANKTQEQRDEVGQNALSLATVFTSNVGNISQLYDDRALPLSPKVNSSPSVLLTYLDSFGSGGNTGGGIITPSVAFAKVGVILAKGQSSKRYRRNHIIKSRSKSVAQEDQGPESLSDDDFSLPLGKDCFMHHALCRVFRVKKRGLNTLNQAKGQVKKKRQLCRASC
jgi:hypothetical protein